MNDENAGAWAPVFHAGGLVNVTGEAVNKVMNNFCLPLAGGWDMAILAGQVRLAWGEFACWESGGPDPDIYGPNRASNTYARARLAQLADLAASTARALDEPALGRAAESALWLFSAEGADQFERRTGAQYWRYLAIVKELAWLSGLLKRAAEATANQRGPWRQSEKRRLRVEKGRALAPIYEAAFGKTASANNWPSGKDREPTPFMDFYRRMMALAFGEEAPSDLPGVLQDALRQHRESSPKP